MVLTALGEAEAFTAMASAAGGLVPTLTQYPAPEAKADPAFRTEAPEESPEAITKRDRLTGATEGEEAAHGRAAAAAAVIVEAALPPTVVMEEAAALTSIHQLF